MTPFQDERVAALFASYPLPMRGRLFALRELLFETAIGTPGVGPLEETLKWGEPAYLTTKTGAGSQIRLHAWKKSPTRYAVFFHCQTSLVSTFRDMFGDRLSYEGNRAVLFDINRPAPADEMIGLCFSLALTYHLRKAGIAKAEMACG